MKYHCRVTREWNVEVEANSYDQACYSAHESTFGTVADFIDVKASPAEEPKTEIIRGEDAVYVQHVSKFGMPNE